MIYYKKELVGRKEIEAAGHDIIIHGCNAIGAFGSGFAGMLAKDYPAARATYIDHHDKNGLSLGDIIWHTESSGLTIAHAITQLNVGTEERRVDYEALYSTLERVLRVCVEYGYTDLALPAIGCGLAGGDFEIFKRMLALTYENLGSSAKNIMVTVYCPDL